MSGEINGQPVGRTGGWRKGGWMSGDINGWPDGWVGGWVDEGID